MHTYLQNPGENPRRRSVGPQNEVRFGQLCWPNLTELAPQAGVSDFLWEGLRDKETCHLPTLNLHPVCKIEHQ